MSDSWMPSLRLKLSRQEFDQLPRHPAYQYEHAEGVACLSPWPRYYHAQLDLERFAEETAQRLDAVPHMRPALPGDIDGLAPIFVGAFARLQPFGSLVGMESRLAAEQSLARTFTGGDGPLIEPASFVAEVQEKIAGAILLTLLPGGDPTQRDSYRWPEAAPADLWTRHQGQPHLTWIFVDRLMQGSGLGTHMLQHAVHALRLQKYGTLWTTFMAGNDSSLLWHWRNGFELLPHVLSKRRR
jgi:GNAT superfamily N-acetyltransferase